MYLATLANTEQPVISTENSIKIIVSLYNQFGCDNEFQFDNTLKKLKLNLTSQSLCRVTFTFKIISILN